MPSPQTLIIGGLAALLAAGSAGVGGYLRGHADGVADERGDRARADLAATVAAVNAALASQDTIDNLTRLSAQTERDRRDAVRVITEKLPHVIEAPVYRHLCIDRSGIELLDQAAAVANGEPTGADIAAPAGHPLAPASGAPVE